jgi:hypothetical protein
VRGREKPSLRRQRFFHRRDGFLAAARSRDLLKLPARRLRELAQVGNVLALNLAGSDDFGGYRSSRALRGFPHALLTEGHRDFAAESFELVFKLSDVQVSGDVVSENFAIIYKGLEYPESVRGTKGASLSSRHPAIVKRKLRFTRELAT